MITTPALSVLALCWLSSVTVSLSAATPMPATPVRVGVYDSRLVAFAHFWSEPEQQTLRRRQEEAQAAKASGDRARIAKAAAAMKAEQSRLHLQVFSTAPVPEALAALQERLPELQRETGVVRFVSQWDEAALRAVAPADRVDVTDRLVREFAVPAAREATLAQLRSAKPLPLWKARALDFFGKL